MRCFVGFRCNFEGYFGELFSLLHALLTPLELALPTSTPQCAARVRARSRDPPAWPSSLVTPCPSGGTRVDPGRCWRAGRALRRTRRPTRPCCRWVGGWGWGTLHQPLAAAVAVGTRGTRSMPPHLRTLPARGLPRVPPAPRMFILSSLFRLPLAGPCPRHRCSCRAHHEDPQDAEPQAADRGAAGAAALPRAGHGCQEAHREPGGQVGVWGTGVGAHVGRGSSWDMLGGGGGARLRVGRSLPKRGSVLLPFPQASSCVCPTIPVLLLVVACREYLERDPQHLDVYNYLA